MNSPPCVPLSAPQRGGRQKDKGKDCFEKNLESRVLK